MEEMFHRRQASLKKLAAKQTRPVQPVAPRPEALTKSPCPSPGIRRGSENNSSEGNALRRGPYRRAKVRHEPCTAPEPHCLLVTSPSLAGTQPASPWPLSHLQASELHPSPLFILQDLRFQTCSQLGNELGLWSLQVGTLGHAFSFLKSHCAACSSLPRVK